jgi:hypothetical protein
MASIAGLADLGSARPTTTGCSPPKVPVTSSTTCRCAPTDAWWRSSRVRGGSIPIPLVIDGDEFVALADGAIARMRMLEAILDDLYGARTLLTDAVVDPVALWGSPRTGSRRSASARIADG